VRYLLQTTPGAPARWFGAVQGFEGMAASRTAANFMRLKARFGMRAARAMKTCKAGLSAKVPIRPKAKSWTGRHWKYLLESNSHAIGDFNMIKRYDRSINVTTAKADGSETCRRGQESAPTAHDIAKFKRVYKSGTQRCQRAAVEKSATSTTSGHRHYKLAQTMNNGVAPFFTRNVDVVDSTHIVVGNDNLPFSSGQDPNKTTTNWLLLEVGDFLKTSRARAKQSKTEEEELWTDAWQCRHPLVVKRYSTMKICFLRPHLLRKPPKHYIFAWPVKRARAASDFRPLLSTARSVARNEIHQRRRIGTHRAPRRAL
jgi:hypothetical protein